MKININKVIILIFSSLTFLSYVYAEEPNLHAIQHKFSVKVGETRAIYPLSSVKGISLSMVNPQDYPILVQTQIKD
ncbi:molecular chaperone, partial [Yersinia enterocolitica]